VVLARLRLPASGVLWDIGAGSGSVGLEAAALRPRLHVVAVEKNPERVALIDRNRLRLGVSNHTTLQADVSDLTNLAALTRLPPPDRIFVGGGGLPAVLNTCFAALSPGGRLLVSAVTLETVHRLYAWSPEHRTDLTALDISHEHTLAGRYHHLKAQNRITLFTFCKPDNAV
ncbi:MAG: precorrin-6Y C5,15-methyltransferase (decarboxylating) subunit CbiT, partial [Bilophila sp.]